MVCVHIISIKVLNGKLHIGGTIFAGLVILPCMALTLLYNDDRFMYSIFFTCSTLLSLVAPLFTLKNVKRINVLYISLLYFGVSSALAASCRWIFRIFINNDFVMNILNILLLCVLLAACYIFSITPVFYNIRRYINLISTKIKILILVLVWSSSIFTFFVSELFNAYPRIWYLILAELSAAAIIISIGFILPLFIVSSSLNASYKAEVERRDLQMQEQINRYREFLRENEDIRWFEHDVNYVILSIIDKLEKNDT